MFSNNNNKVINLIVKRCIKSKRNRNIVAIIAIILTTTLFTTIFTIGSGMISTIKEQNIRKAGADGQVALSMINDKMFNRIKEHKLIKEIAYTMLIADSITNNGLNKWRTSMWYMDDMGLRFLDVNLVSGAFPKADNEIIMDTKTMKSLGVEQKVGTPVKLNYTVKGEQFEKEFILSGYWNTDELAGIGYIIVSRKYLEHNFKILINHDSNNVYYSGYVSAYIMFKNSINIEGKIEKVLSDCGYQMEDEKKNTYVKTKVNPAYQSYDMLGDPLLLVFYLAAILLIIFTGYLIIYNIFQISVVQDIQFYGMLKTLGATKKQIKTIINKQALLLTSCGVPGGLFIGFVLGSLLIPFVLSATRYDAADGISLNMNPAIFIFSALFSLITVLISIRKPEKIAGSVSPIVALNYVGENHCKNWKFKKSKNGGKISNMAYANLARNKARTLLVIISLSLSLILVNVVFTLSKSFDEDKYVSDFLSTDYIISSADYFLSNYTTSEEDLSDSFINEVKMRAGFINGGALYSTKVLKEGFATDSKNVLSFNIDQHKNYLVQFFGIDKFLLDLCETTNNTVIDYNKFNSGKYIILGVDCDERGIPIENDNSIAVGDKLTFYHYNVPLGKYEPLKYEVLAKVKIKGSTITDKSSGSTRFYLPTGVFLSIVDTRSPVCYSFNVDKDNHKQMDEYLSYYTKNIEDLMDYSSRKKYKDAIKNMTMMIIIVGGSLAVVIGLIGVINFLNSIVTSIISRRRELAILQSVGMTGKQLKKMLCLEGIYYAIGTILFTTIFGSVISLVIVREIVRSLNYFSYNFIIWPIFSMFPILIAVTLIVPIMLYKRIEKQHIVERLQNID